jgi:hypothetical protein
LHTGSRFSFRFKKVSCRYIMFASNMTKALPALILSGALSLAIAMGRKDVREQGSSFGADESLLPYLSLVVPFNPTPELSVRANLHELRKLQNTTGDMTDDFTASDDAFLENATVELYVDDLPLRDDAFFDNATFEEACPYFDKAVGQAYLSVFTCRCDTNTASGVCLTPSAVPVQGAPNLEALVNQTTWYDDDPNATAIGEDGVHNIESLRMCYDYRYVVTLKSQNEYPPEGCITVNYSDDGKSVETCLATLTEPNRTLMKCASCSGCSGGVKFFLDCSNVNELAVSDKCYSLDGTETTVIFPDLVNSVGSGGASIATGLRWGLVLVLGHAALLLSVHSS